MRAEALGDCNASCIAVVWMVPVHDGLDASSEVSCVLEHEKGIRWMPWHQEAMKDVARCEKPRGAASRRLSVDIRMGQPTPLGYHNLNP